MLPLPMFFIIFYMVYLFNINVNLKNKIVHLQENTINCNKKVTIIENNKKNTTCVINNNKNTTFEYNSEYLYFPHFHPELIEM